MAECSLCGAITMQSLALAWLERSVQCSNCGIVMPPHAEVLDTLRRQAVQAQAAIERLGDKAMQAGRRANPSRPFLVARDCLLTIRRLVIDPRGGAA